MTLESLFTNLFFHDLIELLHDHILHLVFCADGHDWSFIRVGGRISKLKEQGH